MANTTVVDQIEVTPSGIIQVRLRKFVTDQNGKTHDMGYHRTAIEPGVPVDAVMAMVNLHLAAMGTGEVAPSDPQLDALKNVVSVVHTEQKVSQFRAEKAATLPKDKP